jgi:hypothetical protein
MLDIIGVEYGDVEGCVNGLAFGDEHLLNDSLKNREVLAGGRINDMRRRQQGRE